MTLSVNSEVGVIIPTIERFFPCVSRLVDSIRKNWGMQISIYIGVQGRKTSEITQFSKDHSLSTFFLPYDCGLSVARNFLVRQVREPFILIADDDYVILPETNLAAAVKFLKSQSTIMILGGAYSTCFSDGTVRFENFASQMYLDEQNHLLISVPVAYLDLPHNSFESYHYIICDMVNNIALINKQVFTNYGLYWDEQFKIRGEHEDFFLTIKQANKFQVAYSDCLIVDHCRVTSPVYHELRSRKEGAFTFLKKWNLRQHLFIGRKNIHADYQVGTIIKDPWKQLDDYR